MVALLASSSASAQEILRDSDDPPEPTGVTHFHTPYAFASDVYDFAVGFAYATTGRFQEQLGMYITALGSTNSTWQVMMGSFDARMPGTERLYFDTFLSLGSFSNLQAYVDGNPAFPQEPAGSNESDPEDFIQDSAAEAWAEASFHYLLPLGAGAVPVHTFTLDRGILSEGSTWRGSWNPLESGRTHLGLDPFYRRQEFDLAPSDGLISTNGFELWAEYDNTDFNRNPSQGSRQRVSFSVDPGWFESTNSWTAVGLELDKYFSFTPTENQRQRVLALNLWTADSPSWTTNASGDIFNAPPYFSGATLGGTDRMRAYPPNRFNDKSVIYYSAEYRVIPAWHPLGDFSLANPLDLDWWQWVAFVELGRVADTWNPSELHTDMKWDVGLGLRFMARKQIVRLDFAFAEEGWAIAFAFSQPF